MTELRYAEMENNLDNLKNSWFFKFGQIHFDPRTSNQNELNIKHTAHSSWDTTFVTTDSLDKIKDFDIKHGHVAIRPHLFFYLQHTRVPDNFNKLILKQWTEVNDILSKFAVKPRDSTFFMVPPGADLGTHSHPDWTKQILTFVYSFFDDQAVAQSDAAFYISDQELNGKTIDYFSGPNVPESATYYKFPLEHKICLTFKNNPWHGVTNDNIFRFYWVHNFDDYLPSDIDDSLGDFTSLKII